MDPTNDKEVVKVSVLDEIRRFQMEINKVQAENVKFYQWKLRRSSKTPVPRPRGGGGATLGCAISTDSLLTCSTAGGQKKKDSEKKSPPGMLTVKGQSCNLSQIHSITARTVPLEFRETLKKGKPVQTDSILRLQDLSD